MLGMCWSRLAVEGLKLNVPRAIAVFLGRCKICGEYNVTFHW